MNKLIVKQDIKSIEVSNDTSANKIRISRVVHQSTTVFISTVETPEGPKVGMVKNLSMLEPPVQRIKYPVVTEQ